jgi:hypothetical protein
LVDDHLVEASLNETSGDVFELLASLHEEVVALWDRDGDTLAGVASPYV